VGRAARRRRIGERDTARADGALNSEIKDANTLGAQSAADPRLGTTGGFEFILQSRGGGDVTEFSRVLQNFLGEARKRPELGFVFANFDDKVPQIEYEVDRDKVKSFGIPLSEVFFALQNLPRQLLRQRLQPVRPYFPVQAQAEGYARAIRTTSSAITCAAAMATWCRSARC